MTTSPAIKIIMHIHKQTRGMKTVVIKIFIGIPKNLKIKLKEKFQVLHY